MKLKLTLSQGAVLRIQVIRRLPTRALFQSLTWGSILLFSNGSADCSSGRVGSGFCILDFNCHFALPLQKCLPAMTAKLHLIFSALIHVKKNQLAFSVTCTDSMSTLECIRSRFEDPGGSYLARRIGDLVSDANRAVMTFILMWMSDHAGILGNEMANECTRCARDLNFSV